MMHCYQAFQLTIVSELAFPELLSSPENAADVIIRLGSVSTLGIDDPLKKGLSFQAKNNMFWLDVPKIARFLVTDGRLITIEPVSGIDEDSLRVFLLGSCFGALLMQRGLFLLHGNAIQIKQHAISFVGLSGSGKSTTSAIFFKRGYKVLADDICAVNSKGEVIPSFPQIKIWADVAKQLLIKTQGLRKIRPNLEKYALPLENNFYNQSLPLKGIYILNAHNKDEINIKHLIGIEKFQPLRSQCYRLPYVKGLSQDKQHKLICGQLANRIILARVSRPHTGYHFDKLAEQIESDLDVQGLGRGVA